MSCEPCQPWVARATGHQAQQTPSEQHQNILETTRLIRQQAWLLTALLWGGQGAASATRHCCWPWGREGRGRIVLSLSAALPPRCWLPCEMAAETSNHRALYFCLNLPSSLPFLGRNPTNGSKSSSEVSPPFLISREQKPCPACYSRTPSCGWRPRRVMTQLPLSPCLHKGSNQRAAS